MWKHRVRTPKHSKLVPIVAPWRQSFQPVHTWEPEEPNTGMFYSELCNSIPNFAFHIHTLSREKRADIESLDHSSTVCKGIMALLLSLLLSRNKTSRKRSVKLELSSRDSRQSRCMVQWLYSHCHSEALEELCLLDCPRLPPFWLTLHKAHSWVTTETPQTPREPCFRQTEFEILLQFVLMSKSSLYHSSLLKKCSFYWQVSGEM